MDMVALHSKEDYDAFSPDKWGIPTAPKESISKRIQCLGGHEREVEVVQEEKLNEVNIVIMPGMAFDNKFQRLGHGKGFYDMFLTQYSKRVAPQGKMPFLGKIPQIGEILS